MARNAQKIRLNRSSSCAGAHQQNLQLRQKLTLEEPVETPDDIGGVIRSFAAVGIIAVQLSPLIGRERGEADQLNQFPRYRFTMRWRGEISAAHRLRDEVRVFNIRTIYDPTGQKRFLEGIIEEITA